MMWGWGRCTQPQNGHPLAMGGSRGHGGLPRCGCQLSLLLMLSTACCCIKSACQLPACWCYTPSSWSKDKLCHFELKNPPRIDNRRGSWENFFCCIFCHAHAVWKHSHCVKSTCQCHACCHCMPLSWPTDTFCHFVYTNPPRIDDRGGGW